MNKTCNNYASDVPCRFGWLYELSWWLPVPKRTKWSHRYVIVIVIIIISSLSSSLSSFQDRLVCWELFSMEETVKGCYRPCLSSLLLLSTKWSWSPSACWESRVWSSAVQICIDFSHHFFCYILHFSTKKFTVQQLTYQSHGNLDLNSDSDTFLRWIFCAVS